MKYGYFDSENKEYVITTYNTPIPWMNYLSNGELISLMSCFGGGYTFYKDAKKRRITRFVYNSPSRDDRGRMFYIDDGKSVFSPSFYPAKVDLDHYECHVGLNYTNIISSKNDLDMSLLVFIPNGDNVEISKLSLRNASDKVKTIKLYSGVEFCLWDALDDFTNFQRNFSIGEVEIEGNTIYHKTEYRERRNHFAYFSTSENIKNFETSRDSLLGIHGDYTLPGSIKEGELKNTHAHGWSPVAFFEHEITLKPNEEKIIVFTLGYVENDTDKKFDKNGLINKEKAYKLIGKYSDINNVDNAFISLKNYWDNLLSTYKVSSNDPKLNEMVNVWHQYQCMMTYQLSRSASYYESGIGRGMGFRDSCQDLLGFVHLIPEKAKERIIDIASIMKIDGSCFHQYQPLDKKGNKDIGDGFNDDPLWLIGAVYAYIAETGDVDILNIEVPYDSSEVKDTLLNHLSKAYMYTINHLGPHNLPLIGHADWNDCLNLNCFSDTPGESFQCHQGKDTGIAESLFIAGMFVKYGQEYASILSLLNKDNKEVLKQIELMKENILKHGYDVDHYLRAYDAYGNKVGSYECKDGQIYIEPQGMISLAMPMIKESLMSLNATEKHLDSEYGICLLSPCYKEYHIELGEVSSYPMGYKENGGIFCHNNPWIMIADSLNGNPDRAFSYYKKITPTYIEEISHIHKSEPYVYSQMIAGKEAINHGEAKNSWLTGTAAWTFVYASQYLLGVKCELDGLHISPRMPKEIDSFTLTRKYRGHIVTIKARRDKDYQDVILKDVKEDIEIEVIYQ